MLKTKANSTLCTLRITNALKWLCNHQDRNVKNTVRLAPFNSTEHETSEKERCENGNIKSIKWCLRVVLYNMEAINWSGAYSKVDECLMKTYRHKHRINEKKVNTQCKRLTQQQKTVLNIVRNFRVYFCDCFFTKMLEHFNGTIAKCRNIFGEMRF